MKDGKFISVSKFLIEDIYEINHRPFELFLLDSLQKDGFLFYKIEFLYNMVKCYYKMEENMESFVDYNEIASKIDELTDEIKNSYGEEKSENIFETIKNRYLKKFKEFSKTNKLVYMHEILKIWVDLLEEVTKK